MTIEFIIIIVPVLQSSKLRLKWSVLHHKAGKWWRLESSLSRSDPTHFLLCVLIAPSPPAPSTWESSLSVKDVVEMPGRVCGEELSTRYLISPIIKTSAALPFHILKKFQRGYLAAFFYLLNVQVEFESCSHDILSDLGKTNLDVIVERLWALGLLHTSYFRLHKLRDNTYIWKLIFYSCYVTCHWESKVGKRGQRAWEKKHQVRKSKARSGPACHQYKHCRPHGLKNCLTNEWMLYNPE